MLYYGKNKIACLSKSFNLTLLRDNQQVADVGYFTRELGWTPNYNKLNINLSKVIQFVILTKASTLEIKCQ